MKGRNMERTKKRGWAGLAAALALAAGVWGCATAGGPGAEGEATAPGEEAGEGARLFVMRWNPAVSSFDEDTWREGFARLHRREPTIMDWNAWDWRDIREGDWALWCRVGGEKDGIVGLWRLTGEVEEGASWRGDGKTLHYAWGEILMMNEPSATGLFGAEEMERVAPEVDWHGGHAGVKVDGAVAEKLALHMAERLARAKGLKKADFAAVPSAKAGPRCLACALLSNLCPELKKELRARGEATPAEDEGWLPYDGDEVVYDPAALAKGKGIAAAARLISWEGEE